MKALPLAAALTLAATSVMAQPRPATYQLQCGQVRNLVASRGAVVLNTSPTTYDRFVASRNFCEFNETVEPVLAQTRDTPQCLIGYRCVEAEILFDRF